MNKFLQSLACGTLALSISSPLLAYEADLSEYLFPIESRESKFFSDFLHQNHADYFLSYEWLSPTGVVVHEYASQYGKRIDQRNYAFAVRGNKIEYSYDRSMSAVPGAEIRYVQPMDRVIEQGTINEIYGAFLGPMHAIELESGERLDDCIGFEMKDDTIRHVFCKGVGLVKREALTDPENTLTLARAVLPDWNHLCPSYLEYHPLENREESEPLICGCIEEQVTEQVATIVEYYDSLNPLGNGSFAGEFSSAVARCATPYHAQE